MFSRVRMGKYRVLASPLVLGPESIASDMLKMHVEIYNLITRLSI